MFYCDECAKKNKYPQTSFRSYGRCEICDYEALCNDMPCKYLPEKKEEGDNIKK